MDIRINKLALWNFKGIQSLAINADGKSLDIFGDNATGKTTVFDAFTWLLFNKDSLGRADFGIKTQDQYGNTIHNLDHCVECELAIDNSILTLKKVYAEKWTKKRGSAEAEFTGHETKYFVNEVPTTKKEYEQKIAGFIDEELFKIITNPLYFNEHLKWQERRAILLNLCGGEVDDVDIVSNSPQFLPLLEELKGRTVQEYKKIVQSKQAALNDELKAIPLRISEATLSIPETVAEVDEEAKAICEKKIAELDSEMNAIKNGSGALQIETEIQALKEQKKQIENKRCDVLELEEKCFLTKSDLMTVNLEITDTERNIKSCVNIIADLDRQACTLREEWHKVNEKQYAESETCPTCGQALPTERIEEAKAKFNTARATKLEEITAQGKKTNAEIETFRNKMVDLEHTLDSLKNTKRTCEMEIERLNGVISDKLNDFADKMKVEVAKIDVLIAEAENNRQNATESVQTKIYTIQEQINAERAKIDEINKAIAGRDLAERQKSRIAELEANEKRLAGEYAELDKMAYLIDEFIKHKINLLNESINNHFKYAKFKLFEVQINGGVAECCEVCYKGVPYQDLNNASRINIGIDIINTLCKLNDKFCPVIIDNSESVTAILETASQQIRLVVSADDDALRVEKEV